MWWSDSVPPKTLQIYSQSLRSELDIENVNMYLYFTLRKYWYIFINLYLLSLPLSLLRYATEVDVDFVRKSVRAIGRCAIKVEVC